MILNKIIVGFVCQQYDTEKNQFINQSFIAEVDHEEWEDIYGDETRTPDNAPTLNTDMVQPKINSVVVNDVKIPTSFKVGERVFVITNNDPSSLVFNEFDGTIVGFKLNGIIIQVKDQHDDVFDCDASQVHYYDRFII